MRKVIAVFSENQLKLAGLCRSFFNVKPGGTKE
jgi:hypothetical protein